MIGIYKITSPTNRFYIGQSRDIQRRFNTYKKYDCKSQPKLYNSLLKYGHEYHKFEILIECSESKLNHWETFYIKQFQSNSSTNLNCRMDGEYQCASQETRSKLSLVFKGRIFSEETRRRMSEAMTGRVSSRKGKTSRPDSIIKQRESLIASGKAKGENNGFFGKTHSEISLRKMSKPRPSATGSLNHRAMLVINLDTGIFYESVIDAANFECIKLSSLRKMLSGYRKNKTNLIYA